MKTNMKMMVTLPGGIEVEGYHKTQSVNLTSLWQSAQVASGIANANMAQWLALQKTQRFMGKTSEITGLPLEQLVQVRGSGKSKVTWAHINVAIAAMSYLSPEVHALVIEEFVKGRLFHWRDEGGDGFIDLNATLAFAAQEVLGKPAHTGHYVNLAKIIKDRCGVTDWNKETHEVHRLRAQIEDRLSVVLRAKLVRDWDHLKELAREV